MCFIWCGSAADDQLLILLSVPEILLIPFGILVFWYFFRRYLEGSTLEVFSAQATCTLEF